MMNTGMKHYSIENWSRQTNRQQPPVSGTTAAAFSSLVPSEDDIRQILTQVTTTNPMKLPEAMLQIFCARIMLRQIEKLRDELYDTLRDLEHKVSQ